MQVFMLNIALLPLYHNIQSVFNNPMSLILFNHEFIIALKTPSFVFPPHTSSASLHIWLITMPVLATKVHADHHISLFPCAESSQSETAWLAGLTRTEQMIMLLRRRRKTGPVNCARSSTSRQQRLVMPASPPDGRVSEFCFTPPEINGAPSWPC